MCACAMPPLFHSLRLTAATEQLRICLMSATAAATFVAALATEAAATLQSYRFFRQPEYHNGRADGDAVLRLHTALHLFTTFFCILLKRRRIGAQLCDQIIYNL